MGSEQQTLMSKEFVRTKVTTANVSSLRDLRDRMGPIQKQRFSAIYGNILEVALIEVPAPAIYGLVQYYDQQLRCFTFRDFQILPTIEEFEKIIGLPIEDRKPYVPTGHSSPLARVAEALNIPEKEVASKIIIRNGTKGLSRDYLEKKAHELANRREWRPFMDILALLIFGVVMFPRIGGLVDWAAVDAFLALYHRKESPVTALLADLYLAFDLCYEVKDARFFGCLPALYIWLVNSVFIHGARPSCPLEDFRQCEERNHIDWSLHLAGLTAMKIRWRQRWREIPAVIYKCEGFPNVPLAGTRGGINYNPMLALRQFGCPFRGAPTSVALAPFVARGLELENALPMIARAWQHPRRKDIRILAKEVDPVGNYGHWIETRVRLIKLPQPRPRANDEEHVRGASSSNEEYLQMKTKLRKVEVEKAEMAEEMQGIQKEYEMWREMALSMTQAMEACKKQEAEIKHDYQAQLEHMAKESRAIRQEMDMAQKESQVLTEQLHEAWEARSELRDQLEKAELRMIKVVERREEQMLKERQILAATHGRALREQQARVLELEAQAREMGQQFTRAMDLLSQKEQEVAGLHTDGDLWRDRFAATLRSGEHLPRLVQRAEGMANMFDTPVEIKDLFAYCNQMIECMAHMIRNR